MKRLAIFLGLVVGVAHGQVSFPYILLAGSSPIGNSCPQAPQFQTTYSNGHIYTCANGTVVDITAAGNGTVTSFTDSSGLFSVATATTTPTTTYAAQTANTSFGNFTGSPAAPSFTATTGTGSPVAATSPTLVTPALGTPSALVITNATGTCSTCVSNSATLDAPIASPAFTGTLTTPLETINGNGAASVSPLFMIGTILTGGSGTTNFPDIFVQPTGTTAATTWSTSGTVLGINAPSGFAGNYLDIHINGATSVFSINNNRQITSTGNISTSGTIVSGTTIASMGNVGSIAFQVGNAGVVGWSSTAAYNGGNDTGLDRSAAGVLEVNTGSAGSGGKLKASGVLPSGNYVATAQTSATPAQTLVTTTATSTYMVNAIVTCDTSAAAATVTLTVSYTDPSSTSQSVTPSAAVCTTLGTASIASIAQTIRAKTGTTITVSAAIANSPNYDIAATAMQITTN